MKFSPREMSLEGIIVEYYDCSVDQCPIPLSVRNRYPPGTFEKKRQVKVVPLTLPLCPSSASTNIRLTFKRLNMEEVCRAINELSQPEVMIAITSSNYNSFHLTGTPSDLFNLETILREF